MNYGIGAAVVGGLQQGMQQGMQNYDVMRQRADQERQRQVEEERWRIQQAQRMEQQAYERENYAREQAQRNAQLERQNRRQDFSDEDQAVTMGLQRSNAMQSGQLGALQLEQAKRAEQESKILYDAKMQMIELNKAGNTREANRLAVIYGFTKADPQSRIKAAQERYDDLVTQYSIAPPELKGKLAKDIDAERNRMTMLASLSDDPSFADIEHDPDAPGLYDDYLQQQMELDLPEREKKAREWRNDDAQLAQIEFERKRLLPEYQMSMQRRQAYSQRKSGAPKSSSEKPSTPAHGDPVALRKLPDGTIEYRDANGVVWR